MWREIASGAAKVPPVAKALTNKADDSYDKGYCFRFFSD